jgi:hypothetical protein
MLGQLFLSFIIQKNHLGGSLNAGSQAPPEILILKCRDDCNPSYSASKSWRITKIAQTKLVRPYLKNKTKQKKKTRVGSGIWLLGVSDRQQVKTRYTNNTSK